MKASPTVKSAATMEASAKARLPAGGEASGHATMIKTAESPGMISGLSVRRSESMLRSRAVKFSPVEPTAVKTATSTPAVRRCEGETWLAENSRPQQRSGNAHHTPPFFRLGSAIA